MIFLLISNLFFLRHPRIDSNWYSTPVPFIPGTQLQGTSTINDFFNNFEYNFESFPNEFLLLLTKQYGINDQLSKSIINKILYSKNYNTKIINLFFTGNIVSSNPTRDINRSVFLIKSFQENNKINIKLFLIDTKIIIHHAYFSKTYIAGQCFPIQIMFQYWCVKFFTDIEIKAINDHLENLIFSKITSIIKTF